MPRFNKALQTAHFREAMKDTGTKVPILILPPDAVREAGKFIERTVPMALRALEELLRPEFAVGELEAGFGWMRERIEAWTVEPKVSSRTIEKLCREIIFALSKLERRVDRMAAGGNVKLGAARTFVELANLLRTTPGMLMGMSDAMAAEVVSTPREVLIQQLREMTPEARAEIFDEACREAEVPPPLELVELRSPESVVA